MSVTVFALGSQIVFPEARTAWCPRHLEPFRARWPHGYLTLCIRAFDVISADDRFASRFPVADDGRAILDDELATKLLVSFSPLCEWLGVGVMAMLTNEALAPVPKA